MHGSGEDKTVGGENLWWPFWANTGNHKLAPVPKLLKMEAHIHLLIPSPLNLDVTSTSAYDLLSWISASTKNHKKAATAKSFQVEADIQLPTTINFG